LDIPENIAKEYLIPKNYQKPKIEIGNYYLKWNDKSYGIDQKEITELKSFLKNAISYFDTIYQFLNNLEKSKDKEKYRFHKQFSPSVQLSNRKGHIISYELYMASDGSTLIDRAERIKTIMEDDDLIKNSNAQTYFDKSTTLYFKWNLGELLFNRQGFIGSKVC
jgi:hypothetical protein